MSGHGAPTTDATTLDATGLRVAVVAASWHTTIMDGLLRGARRALADARTGQLLEVRVPGSFELPVAASRLAGDVDAVVALGVVIRGGTPHFDYVCHAATSGLTEVSVHTGTPWGSGCSRATPSSRDWTAPGSRAPRRTRATKPPTRP